MKVKQNETEEYVSSESAGGTEKNPNEVEIIDLTDNEAKAMVCVVWRRMNEDRQVIQKSSDKMWSTVGRNSNPLQYSSWKNHMDSMNRQKRYDTG